MAYKILINSKGVPVLVEIHEPDRKLWFRSEATPADNIAALKKLNSESLSTALADESKHIQFRDELHVKLYCDDLLRKQKGESLLHVKAKIELPVGQTFDLPENIGVSFEAGEMSSESESYKLAILTPQKERLPDDYSLVLINLTSGAITVGRRLRTNNWAVFTSSGMDCESMTNNVEFWMPLPPPPAKN